MRKIIFSIFLIAGFTSGFSAIAGTCSEKKLEYVGNQNFKDDEFLYTNSNNQKNSFGFECDNGSQCDSGSLIYMQKNHIFMGVGAGEKIYLCSTGAGDTWYPTKYEEKCPENAGLTEVSVNNTKTKFYRVEGYANFYCKTKPVKSNTECPDGTYKVSGNCLQKCSDLNWAAEFSGSNFEMITRSDCAGYACKKGYEKEKSASGKYECKLKENKPTPPVKPNPTPVSPDNSNAEKVCNSAADSGAKWDSKTKKCSCTDVSKPKWNESKKKCDGDSISPTPIPVTPTTPETLFKCDELTLSWVRNMKDKYSSDLDIVRLAQTIIDYCTSGKTDQVTFDTDVQKLRDLIAAKDSSVSGNASVLKINDAYAKIQELSAGFDVSVWKNKEGNFNTSRLISDSVAGVVLGTAGGLITSSIIKKNQVENGFDDITCTVGGQVVAGWEDQFTVGIK